MGYCARDALAHGFFQHLRGAPVFAPCVRAKAGLRGCELEEVCDPAWKVVDESDYAEGVRYLRTTYDIPRRRRDPAQPKICSFFPHENSRARCWTCGAKHA